MSGTTVKTWRGLGRSGWAFGLALGLAAASATSCLGANEDHCLYNGGDLACGGGERCVFAPQGGKADGVGDDGCFAGAAVPDRFVHAEFGLPARLEAVDGDPMDVASVEGVLRRTSDCDDSLTKEALEQRFGEESNPESLVSTVMGFRSTLTSGGGIVKSKYDITVGTGECDPEMVAMGMEPLCVYNEELRKGCDEPPDTTTSTSGDTDTLDTTADTTATSSGETSEPECTGSGAGECMNPTPVCSPMGECVPCTMDVECAAEDSELPLCEGGQCVQCRAGNVAICTALSLVCDDPSHTCVPCTEHEQCEIGACEIALGTCFPPQTVVVHVDEDGGQDYMTVVGAVGSIDDGAHGVIVVHEKNNGLGYAGVAVDGGKTIALLVAADEQPFLTGSGDNPGLRVEEAGTVVYVDGLTVSGNTMGLGLQVTAATVWVDRSRIVQNTGGGIVAESAANLTLRNSFVTASGNGISSVVIANANARINYSTMFSSAFSPTAALSCSGAVNGTLRNSIVVTEGGALGDEVSCAGLVGTYNATEALLPGEGNTSVGSFPDGSPDQWFVNVVGGDLGLQNEGIVIFDDVARWQDNDPTIDIDGDARANMDGSPDYAGADVP